MEEVNLVYAKFRLEKNLKICLLKMILNLYGVVFHKCFFHLSCSLEWNDLYEFVD